MEYDRGSCLACLGNTRDLIRENFVVFNDQVIQVKTTMKLPKPKEKKRIGPKEKLKTMLNLKLQMWDHESG